MTRYLIQTLGCKVNQCESAAVARALDHCGGVAANGDQPPDLVVVNTCAVTGKAGMQSRQVVRQAVRRYPQAKIVVTGCYAQIASPELAAIPGVDLIVGHAHKLDTTQWLSLCRDPNLKPPHVLMPRAGEALTFAAMGSAAVDHRTRAFLKIQDGCNTRCTYCVVPLARGPSRSMPVADVFDHMKSLGSQNYREVVLTGIHLGAYGADLKPATTLADLLTLLIPQLPVARLRLSSIEPTEIDERIIALMAVEDGGLCRHWHIPLQSGDDTVLRRMGRGYGREAFAQVVNGIHGRIPAAAIGVDVLVGFPGEDEEAFENTYNLIESLPVTYLHVFPYSPRPGTPAAGYKDQVHSRITKNRCRRLRRLSESKRNQFHRAQLGTHTRVLVETSGDPETRSAKGTSDNYLPVSVAGTAVAENTLVTVRLEALSDDGIFIGRLTTP